MCSKHIYSSNVLWLIFFFPKKCLYLLHKQFMHRIVSERDDKEREKINRTLILCEGNVWETSKSINSGLLKLHVQIQ